MLIQVYTCQNATLLEITCHGSIKVLIIHYMVKRPKIKITIRLNWHLKCFTSRLQVKIVHNVQKLKF